MSGISKADILGVTRSVTKKWTKQRKAEERGSRQRCSRAHMFSNRVNFTDVAGEILPGAYSHASGDGRCSVPQRTFFYACREKFRKATGRPIDFNYFANNILRKYLNQNPAETATWKVTADARGTFTIPNAGHEVKIPCGTLQIDRHLAKAARVIDPFDVDTNIRTEWPSVAPRQRYQAVLYIEKEGFDPLLEEIRIAERFDLALLSCKGQSVKAARKLVDAVCAELEGVPLFVVHDFDKSGFEISQNLTHVSDRARSAGTVCYEFENAINVTDLGLRLTDVEQYGLEDEECEFKGGFASDSICTDEEKEFLRSNRRVELNAFTSPQLIEWLEAKLVANGLGKRLVPGNEVLEDAYRRAIVVAKLNLAIEEAEELAVESAQNAKLPKTLKRQLRAAMKNQDEPWDRVLYQMINEKVKNGSF